MFHLHNHFQGRRKMFSGWQIFEDFIAVLKTVRIVSTLAQETQKSKKRNGLWNEKKFSVMTCRVKSRGGRNNILTEDAPAPSIPLSDQEYLERSRMFCGLYHTSKFQVKIQLEKVYLNLHITFIATDIV